ncbi:hypothetical protein AAMO2058_001147600 [Amorphochlora amoebiformis]
MGNRQPVSFGHREPQKKFRSRSPPPSPTRIERLELWSSPLENSVAAAAGGLHSYLVVRTHNYTTQIFEKLGDGLVHIRKVSRQEMQNKRNGNKAQLLSSAGRKDLKSHMSLRTLKRWARSHEGKYDIHKSNCHRMASDVWNRAVKDKSLHVAVLQLRLSYWAKALGFGASQQSVQGEARVGQLAGGRQQDKEAKKKRDKEELDELRREVKERIRRYERERALLR